MLKTLVSMLLLATQVGAAPPELLWQADLAHCRAEFTVQHMVLSKVWGHIPITRLDIAGTPGSVVPAHLETTMNVAHEDTDNHDRDADLRSPTYFDVVKYPTMTFVSTSIVAKDANNFTVTGNLTIKDVTKPVTFPVQVVGVIPEGKAPYLWRVGYTGTLQIDRRDWGIVDARLTPAGVLLVGYSVSIGLTVEAVTNDPRLHATTS